MQKRIVIIDYGAGNIQSLRFALERLGYCATLSSDSSQIKAAHYVIFPGQGEASSAMKKLREHGLDKLIPTLRQPVLGICLGLQLLCEHSEEGDTTGLGIFNTVVKRFPAGLKIPQIGWNTLKLLDNPLFKGIPNESYAYLVHSYYADRCAQTIATSNYGFEYSTALHRDNFYGVQFHPEKSSKSGAQLLDNFIHL